MKRALKVLAATVAAVTVAAGCSSSSKGASGGGRTYTVGVLTDLTGPGSNTGDSTEAGVKAGIGLASEEGYHIKYVLADTGTSLSGSLNAAKKLVEQDHVFAVIQISVVGFAAADYLKSKNIPVVGADVDGPEWLTDANMFSTFGYGDYTKVQTTYGDIFKKLGVTVLGGIAYGIEPASYDVVKSSAISAQLAGIKVGYVDTQLPFGDTNVGPIALAMKSAGINGLYTGVVSSTSFALVKALEQQGVTFKALLPTGYGGDLTGGGAGAEQAAQGVYFTDGYQPFEMQTAATKRMAGALQKYSGVSGDPTLSEYLGYTAIDGVVQGLKVSGSNPTQADFIKAMLGIKNYDAQGLWGGHSVSFALQGRGSVTGADNCDWITQYSGSTFHLVPGLDPICGTTVPNRHV